MFRTTLITLCLALTALAPLAAQNRYALVIGNAAYTGFKTLPNTVNDAEDVAAALDRLRYTVDKQINANRRTMRDAILRFRDNLTEDPDNEGFLWYAGHAVQYNGENYLLPCEAEITRIDHLKTDAIELAFVTESLKEAGNNANIVVLDACRNNPFAQSRGAAERGLSILNAAAIPRSTLVLYSTQANQTAADGAADERNSPFARAFLDHLFDETDFNEVFASVTKDTYNATGGQEPTRYGQILISRYSLAGIKPQALPVPAAAPETKRVIPIPKTMAFVQGGSFTMGSGGDVIRINSFVIGKNEVTEGEYEAVTGKNPSKNPKGANYPVENVSWFDAVEYCNRLSARDGLTPAYTGSGVSVQCDFSANGYRLPTEAEWEFAAKGGIVASRLYRYAGGNTLADVGWYQARSQTNRSKHPVSQKKANDLGLYDMSGNVYEWCWDWENPPSGSSSKDARRVVRGGAYCYGEANAEVTSRFGVRPTDWGEYIGFRIARNE